ncbi:MAG TPA: thioredoxin domain-containing protein [Candidatus Acidoferrales bacterium]|nr:thioredoxin domain-containing protein [Candidatus Acidoferrales bacterium]
MNIFRSYLITFVAILVSGSTGFAQTPPGSAPAPSTDQAQILQSTEAFVRNLYAWGPEFQVRLGPMMPSASANFYLVPIHVTINGQTDTGSVYVSKDGKTFLRGDMYDMSSNPFSENLAHLNVEGNPSMGPANARVTIVEFSDFQCPHCRELFRNLKTLETQYPQVRVVYKDFPLTQIHPWTETASIGARCAYIQSPDAFWKVHDSLFENQDLISTENIWEKLVGFASSAGLDTGIFKACVSSTEAKQAVERNRADGEALGVNSTPTVFVNGRMLASSDKSLLEQYIKYELARPHSNPPPPYKPLK